jgi:hypothetical protein
VDTLDVPGVGGDIGAGAGAETDVVIAIGAAAGLLAVGGGAATVAGSGITGAGCASLISIFSH